MSPYTHLTLKDRECILLGVTLHHTYQVIADQIGCSKATVSREIKRNGGRGAYSAVKAQQNYQQRRLKSRRLRVLENLKLR
ncbi:IS30 family transposase, partial [Lactiplantibacillus pentosus]